jgi:hypothetical protein
MRALIAMLRWLSFAVFSLVFLIAAVTPVHADVIISNQDTGTYRILGYTATLEPQSNGSVRITCEQEWQVLSGNIPWITVGLPDSSFSVENWGGAAFRVYPANSGGWSGVRVDLDRAYLTGDKFRINFTVLQNNLLERLTSDKKWRISYVPGWYDRATIERLTVVLKSPVNLKTYILVDPVPLTSADNIMTWGKNNLSPGERVWIEVESLDGGFLDASTPGAKKNPFPWPVVIGILVVAGFVGLVVFAVVQNAKARKAALKERIAAAEREMTLDPEKKEAAEKGFREYIIQEDIQPDEQGRYYDRSYGDYITPAIWAAVILNQQQTSQASSSCVHSSCACACVSCACACACACAGGGAAGCARKTLHECRDCLARNSHLTVE